MNRHMKTIARIILSEVAVLLTFFILKIPTYAAATDEILNFAITIDVNEDASLNMTYHIEWKVLDDSIGELEWLDIGMPNSYHGNITPLSDTIDFINDMGNSLEIYLDRGYKENETVIVEFSLTQDHMYQIDKYVEGETVYTFTPAWFDEIDVDTLTILWNAAGAGAWQPDCYEENGYLVFYTSLSAGDRYTMSVTYPNDAFGFASDRQEGSGDSGNSGYNDPDFGPDNKNDIFDIIGGLVGFGIFGGMIAVPIILITRFQMDCQKRIGLRHQPDYAEKDYPYQDRILPELSKLRSCSRGRQGYL
ncbi:MAG: hypothetical protein IKH67_01335 [Lachnospiraceae bacterium]|nr:hypothetical protein [Lachnospiraceae bacterium]